MDMFLIRAATALIRPLAWESPYATGVALENAKRHTHKKIVDLYTLHTCNLYICYIYIYISLYTLIFILKKRKHYFHTEDILMAFHDIWIKTKFLSLVSNTLH